MSFLGRPSQVETHETWLNKPNQVQISTPSDRGRIILRMETALQVLAWAGVVAAAAVTAALVVGVLFST